MAADLKDAAYSTYSQLSTWWADDTLRSTIVAFYTSANPLFQDSVPNDRPVGNWLVLIKAALSQMPTVGQATLEQFNQIVEYVFRMCFAGYTMAAAGLITGAQATALTDVWNNSFGG